MAARLLRRSGAATRHGLSAAMRGEHFFREPVKFPRDEGHERAAAAAVVNLAATLGGAAGLQGPALSLCRRLPVPEGRADARAVGELQRAPPPSEAEAYGHKLTDLNASYGGSVGSSMGVTIFPVFSQARGYSTDQCKDKLPPPPCNYRYDLPPPPQLPPTLGIVKCDEVPHLPEFKFHCLANKLMLHQLSKDSKRIMPEFDVANLKTLYLKYIRLFLVSSGLLVEDQVNSLCFKNLREQQKQLGIKKYLTTLDVMLRLMTLDFPTWKYLLDSLRDNMVLVVESWNISLGSIVYLVYDHGLRLANRKDDGYVGQCDASYFRSGKTGTTCSLIWNGNKVWDCVIHKDIDCSSSVEAELWGMYILQRRGIDLRIEEFEVITDNDTNFKAVAETEVIAPNSKNVELGTVVRGLKKYYLSFICRLEPREKLLFPDTLASRDVKFSHDYVLKKWAHHLLGYPIFRIHQIRESSLNQHLGNPQGQQKLNPASKIYRVEVDCIENKIIVVRNIILSMGPKMIFVIVKDEESAATLENELKNIITGYDIEYAKGARGFYEIILSDGAPISSFTPSDKTLDIVFDGLLCHGYSQQESRMCIQILTVLDEVDSSVPELRPEALFYFKGILDMEA